MKQFQSLSSLTFPLHPHGQALLVTAVLAAVPLSLVHSAVFIVPAGIGQILAHRPLEEAFTALAAVNAVVLTWSVRQEKAKVRNQPGRFQGDRLKHLREMRTVWRASSHQRICLRRCNRGVSGKAWAPGRGTRAASSPAEASHRQSCSLRVALTWTPLS